MASGGGGNPWTAPSVLAATTSSWEKPPTRQNLYVTFCQFSGMIAARLAAMDSSVSP